MDRFTKIVYKLIDIGDGVNRLKSSIERFVAENKDILRDIMSGEEVLVSDFLELYDMRIYDMSSKQNDIKYMKQLDFKGIYFIKNLTKKKCYLGKGDKVFKKVDRHFRGYGNSEIYADYVKKNKFVVCFWSMERSGFEDFNSFEKERRASVKKQMGSYTYYDGVTAQNEIDKEGEILKEKKVDIKENRSDIKDNAKQLKQKRIKAFWFNRKRIALEFSVEDFNKEKYAGVVEKIKQNGFTNIQEICVKDVYVDNKYTIGEVEQVLVDGRANFKQGEMVPYDAKILVIYHLKKEISFPYSPRQVKKKNHEVLSKELCDKGFTVVNTVVIKDLKTGWLVKEGSVEMVKVNGKENYAREMMVEYDAEIDIYYHTFG